MQTLSPKVGSMMSIRQVWLHLAPSIPSTGWNGHVTGEEPDKYDLSQVIKATANSPKSC